MDERTWDDLMAWAVENRDRFHQGADEEEHDIDKACMMGAELAFESMIAALQEARSGRFGQAKFLEERP